MTLVSDSCKLPYTLKNQCINWQIVLISFGSLDELLLQILASSEVTNLHMSAELHVVHIYDARACTVLRCNLKYI